MSRQTRRIRDLNRQLLSTIEQKEMLIEQKEYLLGEIDHRVQNSLQLVSSFLSLQARDPTTQGCAMPSRKRGGDRGGLAGPSPPLQLRATGNRRCGRYVDELLDDLVASIGPEWDRHLVRDLQPVMVPNDRAVGLGLALTELVINANKYAYGGAPGPLRVTLGEDRSRFRLTVADEGVGRTSSRKGFGSKLLGALVAQLGGSLDYEDGAPGTRAILSAPVEAPRRT